MNTPNDLPSVGTEDALKVADRLQQYWSTDVAAMLRALVSERDELASRVRELENLRLEAVAEGFESIAEYVANLRTSASTYFAERNSARDVARKHRKTIESVEAALASKEHP